MSTPTAAIRNIAIIGHGGTGKTTIFEQIMVSGGVIPKFEPVEAGRSVSDHAEEEIARKISIRSALGNIGWNDHKINVLDTPGSADFVGEVVAALHVAETAVVVVSGDAGVQIETAKLWRRLERTTTPRIVFVNQMDKERADFDSVLADLKERFGGTFVPLVAPLGAGDSFTGVVDLLANKALSFADGKPSAIEIPADQREQVEEYRQAMVEGAAEGDDALMEKYLEEEQLSDDEVLRGLAASLRSGAVVPVIAGVATAGAGIDSLLDVVQRLAASPVDASAGSNGTEPTRPKIDEAGEASAFVFKTSIDQYAGKLSWIKVMSGSVKADTELVVTRDRKKERITKLYSLQGAKLDDVDGLAAGDLGVLAKLSTAVTGDTLSAGGEAEYPPLDLPQPVHAVTINTSAKQDEDKLGQLLQRAAEEDPTLRVNFNPETKETVISAMGELQLSIAMERIKSAAGIEVETSVPRVAYRETITGSATADYQHKKQTGGHGQYAKVTIEIKPLPRGEDFKFNNNIFGGAISRGYIPGVEKGIREGMANGVVAGYQLVDIEASVTDGKEHSVDSSEMAFSLAARGALRDAVQKAKPVLLEPVVELTVLVEESYLGDVLSDLSGRRGKIQGQEPIGGGILEVKAQVPQAEMMRYAIDLKSTTSGTASFEVAFSHYAPLTGRLAEDVIKRAQGAETVEAGAH